MHTSSVSCFSLALALSLNTRRVNAYGLVWRDRSVALALSSLCEGDPRPLCERLCASTNCTVYHGDGCIEGALSFEGAGWVAYTGGVTPAELADLAGGSYQREFLEGYHASSGSTDGAKWGASRAESRRAVLDRVRARGYRVSRRQVDRRMVVVIAPPVSGLAVGPVCRKTPAPLRPVAYRCAVWQQSGWEVSWTETSRRGAIKATRDRVEEGYRDDQQGAVTAEYADGSEVEIARWSNENGRAVRWGVL